MDKLPFSLAFVMVKESFAGPAILFYLASNATKNKRQDHLKLLKKPLTKNANEKQVHKSLLVSYLFFQVGIVWTIDKTAQQMD
jgi:hypothetical protein